MPARSHLPHVSWALSHCAAGKHSAHLTLIKQLAAGDLRYVSSKKAFSTVLRHGVNHEDGVDIMRDLLTPPANSWCMRRIARIITSDDLSLSCERRRASPTKKLFQLSYATASIMRMELTSCATTTFKPSHTSRPMHLRLAHSRRAGDTRLLCRQSVRSDTAARTSQHC